MVKEQNVHDLLATHKIIEALERSKYFSDFVLDNLPSLYLVIGEDGTIFRANRECSQFLGVDIEDLWRRNFSHFFQGEIWNIFSSHLQKVAQNSSSKVEFELPIVRTDLKEKKTHFWQIRPFSMGENQGNRSPEGNLFVVIGMDISALREAEREIAGIFSTIPLGLLTIGETGQVEGRYSDFTEYILQTDKITGQNIKELLFDPCWSDLLASEKQGISNMMKSFGQKEKIFSFVKESFPKQVRMVTQNDDSGIREFWLGLSYQGVVVDGILTKILMIIEDRTKIVRGIQEDARIKWLEDKTVERVMQLKSCDSDILALILEEIHKSLPQLGKFRHQNDVGQVKKILHNIKGNCQMAGFRTMGDLAQSMEALLKEELDKDQDPINWKNFNIKFKEMSAEWEDIGVLHQALARSPGKASTGKEVGQLFNRYNRLLADSKDNPKKALRSERLLMSIQFLNYSPLSSLEELVTAQVRKLCKEQNRKVDVGFDWKQAIVNEATRSELSGCLLQLVNYFFNHGPETLTLRGKIKLGSLHFSISGTGAGIDISKVKARMLERGLLTYGYSVQIKDEEALQAIFLPEFGSGLDSVANTVKKLGGSIKAESRFPHGPEINFDIRYDKEHPLEFTCGAMSDFVTLLADFIDTMDEEGFSMTFNSREISHLEKKYLVYMDMNKLCLALTTLIGHFSKFRKTQVTLKMKGPDILCEVNCEGPGGADGAENLPPEYKIPLARCEDILSYHNGSLERKSENEMLLSFGHVLGRENILPLRIGLGNGFNLIKNGEILKDTMGVVQKIFSKHSIEFEFDLKNENDPNVFLRDTDPPAGMPMIPFIKISKSAAALQRECFTALKNLINSKSRGK